MSQYGGDLLVAGPDGPELAAFMTKKAHLFHFLEETVPGILIIKLEAANSAPETDQPGPHISLITHRSGRGQHT
jgi:hypothetical protein